MNFRKVYVDVDVSISKNGDVCPKSLRYEDNQIFPIDRLLGIRRNSTSTNVDGGGIRYSVMIAGHEKNLFDENGRWFVEAKL